MQPRHGGCLAIVLVLLLAPPPRAAAAEQTLLLDVHINGYSIGAIGEFTLRDGALLARRSELNGLGLRVPSAADAGPEELVDLRQLSGLTWRLDESSQTIFISAGNDQRLPSQLVADAGGTNRKGVESGVGATLNYDVSGTRVGGGKFASGLFDLRGFSRWGVVNSGVLVRTGSGAGSASGTLVTRLDAAAQYSDVDTLRTYRVGDLIAGSLSWTRPIRLAGVQFMSDYSTQPHLVTFPLPTLSGIAVVPSVLDVYADGIRLFSDHVEPGPFQIPQLPVVSGAGTISMMLTNALGNQVVSTMSFYTSTTLLAPGLQTFSVQGGAVRRYFGLRSNDYGDLAGSVVYRRGLTQKLTFESTAEGTTGLLMTGAGVDVNVFDLAVIDAAAAVSRGLGHSGAQLSFGIQRVGPLFSYSGTATLADRNYLDTAAMNGDPPPRLQLTGTLGIPLGALGALGIAYARVDRPAASLADTTDVPTNAISYGRIAGLDRAGPVHRARLLSLSYSIQLRNVSVFATAYDNLSRPRSRGMLLSLTAALGPRSSASASAGDSSAGSYWQLQAQQSAAAVGDWGYQAYSSGGDGMHQFGQAQYKWRYALLTAGADRNAGQTSLHLQSQGAFSVVEGTVFGSNWIPDSFALVRTGNLPNVHVLQENREAGSTNYRGMLLVPDLRAFEINHLAIDPEDVPLDATIDATAREVRPQDRSGVVVHFPVRLSHGALLRLVDESGAAMPVGSTARLLGTGVSVPVGYDGSAYVQDLLRHNEIVVERPDGKRCSIAFDYAAIRGEIPTIGPLHCKGEMR